MAQDLNQTIALLARTPSALDGLLRGLPETLTHAREGEGTWTVFEVVGYLIHGDRTDWMQRAKIVMESGEATTFPPFDRLGQARVIEGRSLADLLDEFERVRTENLATLQAMNLQPEDLERRRTHPAFGSVTLSELLATWAAHDLTHLHQISRIMAYQYKDAVGPWSKYLGVMQCGGHSAAS